jgi:hypothetical protein
MSADDWEQEIEFDRAERERVQAIQQYQASKRADRTSEDYVDTTPIPQAEAEPVFQSAKKTVVKTKKRIKKTVKKN